jgi:hypothetical protein
VGGELLVDVGSVRFYGFGTDTQLLRYLLGGEATNHKVKDLALAQREL